MPMYSFACEQCGKRFEELSAYDRRHEVTCPTCGSTTRVLAAGCAVKAGAGVGAASPAPVRSGFS